MPVFLCNQQKNTCQNLCQKIHAWFQPIVRFYFITYWSAKITVTEFSINPGMFCTVICFWYANIRTFLFTSKRTDSHFDMCTFADLILKRIRIFFSSIWSFRSTSECWIFSPVSASVKSTISFSFLNLISLSEYPFRTMLFAFFV